MTVYFAPGNNNNTFLGDLGRGAAQIVTNLIGQQIGAMFDRAAKAKQVEAQRSVMSFLNGGQATPGAVNPNDVAAELSGISGNGEQMITRMMSAPNWAKMSPEQQQQMLSMATMRDRNYGIQQYENSFGNLYGADAAKSVTGANLAGLPAQVQLASIQRAAPEYKQEAIDTGDKVQVFQRNPFQPGYVDGTQQDIVKGNSPDEVLKSQDRAKELASRKELEMMQLKQNMAIALMQEAAQERRARAAGAGDIYKNGQILVDQNQGYSMFYPNIGKSVAFPAGTIPISAIKEQKDQAMQYKDLKDYRDALADRLETLNGNKETLSGDALKSMLEQKNRLTYDINTVDAELQKMVMGRQISPTATTSAPGTPANMGATREQIKAALLAKGVTPEQAEAALKANGL